ncbi:MAG: hypothetical protein QMC79_08730 [Anaerosomatales bacterium]|nr:hypothetical protein [Anaerosomatales bacterium]
MTETTRAETPTAEAQAAETRFSYSYAQLYAFTLVLFIPAIWLVGLQDTYAFDAPYLATMTIPPLVAFFASVVAHEGWTGTRQIGRSLLLGASSMVLGGAVFLSLAWLIAFLGPALESREWGGIQLGIVIVFGLLALPLLVTAARQVRPGGRARVATALACVAAIAVIAGTAYLTMRGGSVPITETLRKDQASYLVGAVIWYIPAYALVGTVLRRVGVV